MNLTQLLAIVGKLATDFKQLDADARAYFTANPPQDPAGQQQVNAITASLQTIDDGMQQLDAAAKAVPPAGGGAPA